jgi:hypothetical protein
MIEKTNTDKFYQKLDYIHLNSVVQANACANRNGAIAASVDAIND